jgi:glucosamine--fructose-6-phosphate aminotransferase (isomerizing)
MNPSPLNTHINSLPELIRQLNDELAKQAENILEQLHLPTIHRIYLTGCGDSHHAGICTSYLFSQLTGLPCIPLQAMDLARYQTQQIKESDPNSCLVIGISASGQVSRTIEALALAKKAGAITIAATGNIDSPLATTSDYLLPTSIPNLDGIEAGVVVPGARSYVASMLALFHSAISFAELAQKISTFLADRLRKEIFDLAEPIRATININETNSKYLADRLTIDERFVYGGAGPNFGTAMFSAAKLLEASGDAAIAYDLEEWAHLEYFSRTKSTIFILSNAGRDEDRAMEISKAAKTIDLNVILIAPKDSELGKTEFKDLFLPLVGEVRELFSPLLSCIPGLLFASARSEALLEPYFRDFGGGRSREEGGGISRIQSSHRLEDIPD